MPGMQLGMVGGQFPPMMQMPQGAQMQGAMGQGMPGMSGMSGMPGMPNMPMGYMMLSQEQLRQMTPQQQMQLQMQMMMSKGMMPGMMQMPKNDGNDQGKK